MKNSQQQTDLIVRVVLVVLALIACGVIAYQQPQPVAPADPERVPAVQLQLPAGTVVRSNSLPGSSNQPGQTPGAPSGGPQMGGGAPQMGGGGGASASAGPTLDTAAAGGR